MPSFLCSNSLRSTRSTGLGGAFDLEILDRRPGFLLFRASGPGARRAFLHEFGGIRWQRVPPTEKRCRRHTSTVTVAVLPEPTEIELALDPKDLEWDTTRGSGAGGQHRNKTESAVRLLHKPTGLTVRCESERSQHQNRATALALLRARLLEARRRSQQRLTAQSRRLQVGSGMRGDKGRTVSEQNDRVTDHRTGKSTTIARYRKGFLEDLLDG
jgi:peptide chain release factor 1